MANTTTGPGTTGGSGDSDDNDLIGWLASHGVFDEDSPAATDRSGEASAAATSPEPEAGTRLRVVAGTSADGDRDAPASGPGSDAAEQHDAGQEDDHDSDVDSPAVEEVPASWEDLLQEVASPSSPESGSAQTPRRRPLPRRRLSTARPARVSGPPPSAGADDDAGAGGGGVSRGVMIAAGAVVVLSLAAAVVAGRSFMGGDQTPVAAAPDPSEMTQPASTPAAPPTTSTPVKNKGLPPNDQPVFAGTCPADAGGELIGPSQKSARAAFAAFQSEYYARNVDGVRALISDQDRAWRDQDWPKFLSQLPEGATWCVTMGPDTGMGSFTATVDQTAGGTTDTFKYQVKAVMGDGNRWFIKHLDAI
ncbi:hypothetical protein [Corynebacterium bovis]|uniref:hypothetical protein n=1 Tax=Corynebacterium bovis TaxID=36808 RepID=UPI000F634088|nr:hypothetical protein [Corynebacterium bovis]RRO90242.1 hypothetical protein CXF30_01135 [Corynebacterium bovis]